MQAEKELLATDRADKRAKVCFFFVFFFEARRQRGILVGCSWVPFPLFKWPPATECEETHARQCGTPEECITECPRQPKKNRRCKSEFWQCFRARWARRGNNLVAIDDEKPRKASSRFDFSRAPARETPKSGLCPRTELNGRDTIAASMAAPTQGIKCIGSERSIPQEPDQATVGKPKKNMEVV